MVLGLFQLDSTGISIVLLLALVAAFVVAFKVMEMIFDTVIISVMSAGFYLVMRYIQGGNISINDLLLFTFLGAGLYMVYSTLATAYRAGSTIIPLPYKIFKTLLSPLKYLLAKLREQRKSKNSRSKGGDDDKSTKEVVLGNKDED
jgi:hypothetical protein